MKIFARRDRVEIYTECIFRFGLALRYLLFLVYLQTNSTTQHENRLEAESVDDNSFYSSSIMTCNEMM